MTDDRLITTTEFERVDLALADTFTIARGQREAVTNHLVTLTDGDGRVGLGGAVPSAYYGESAERIATVLPDLLDIASDVGDPRAQQRIQQRLADHAPEEAAARGAVSLAVHDLAARQRGEALYRQWGLDPAATPATSVTVPIDDPAAMADRAARWRRAGYPALKVKLGTDADRERLRAVREAAPDATIRVDANGAWTPEQAVANLSWLADRGVELLEQPVAAGDIDGLARVTERSPMPVAADESCVTAADVPGVSGAVDVVVVKLMKCGGLRPALAQITTAHAHGLDAMLGCMLETSGAIAGACHLAPLVSYADLDGALLLAEDVCTGVALDDGIIDIAGVAAGTGARRL